MVLRPEKESQSKLPHQASTVRQAGATSFLREQNRKFKPSYRLMKAGYDTDTEGQPLGPLSEMRLRYQNPVPLPLRKDTLARARELRGAVHICRCRSGLERVRGAPAGSISPGRKMAVRSNGRFGELSRASSV
jgi:hypothetical protein